MLDERGLTDVEIEVDGGVNLKPQKSAANSEPMCSLPAMPFILLPTLPQ